MITKIYFSACGFAAFQCFGLHRGFFRCCTFLIFYDDLLSLFTKHLFAINSILHSLNHHYIPWVALWFSAMDVLYRDIGYIIPFICQLWMYLTPIAYGSG
jgi:lipopolysaccharide transport system permease protein